MDISKLCRGCMKEVASWETENYDSRAVEMFSFCTNIKISDEDNLPKQFCYDCTFKTTSSFKFIKEAQKVNVKLKNIASRVETSIIVKPDNHKNVHIPNVLKLTLPNFETSVCFTNTHFDHNSEDEHDKIDMPITNEKCVEISKVKNNKDLNLEIDNKKNVCPVCRKGFVSKVWFSKHMEKEHTGTSHKYTCPQCPKSFSRRSQLSYHATSHSDESKFSCLSCGKRFKRLKQLTIHTRGHSDARPYSCDKCTMRFKMKSVLQCHMKVHEGDKQYLCSFCGWSFAQAGNLEVHMRKHTGEKPFACKECGFRASVASSLRRHERRHRGARTYVCDHCRKGFYDASALNRHRRTHTGELPYKCPGCARAFADSWKRKTHLMRTHRLALHDIPRMTPDGHAV